MSDDRIGELEAEVRELRRMLETSIDATRAPRAVVTSGGGGGGADVDAPVTRRAALRTAGVLAAGAIAGGVGMVASAAPAAATTAGPYTATATDPALAVVAADGQSAIIATSTTNVPTIDAIGYPAIRAIGNFGGVGVIASGSYGVVATGTAIGVQGTIPNARLGSSRSAGGNFEGTVGVLAYGVSSSTHPGVGVWTAGDSGAIRLTGSAAAPPDRLGLALYGTIDIDLNGDVWLCTADGYPGTWRKIAGPSTGGAFHPIAPVRAYDSRRSAYTSNGVIANSTSRLVSVADSHNTSTGVLVTSNVVPAGATAVAANVTVTGTTGAGFFCVNPGGTTTLGASTINWFGAGQTLANGVILTLNATREVTIVAGNAPGSAHCIIDVTGYWL